MKLYLSSFRIGNEADVLRTLVSGRTLGFIPNAMDHVEVVARESSNARALAEVRDLEIDIETLDLREFFGRSRELEARLQDLGGVWVRGGNSFVLRQAMRLSGFDGLVKRLEAADFLYAGYSAGVCVLAPTLEGLRHVDDPHAAAYPDSDVIWEGLGILDYLILPHYRSDHPESAAIDREVDYCREIGIPFRTLRDGEVIVIEDLPTADSA
jgi:dipeptidase E